MIELGTVWSGTSENFGTSGLVSKKPREGSTHVSAKDGTYQNPVRSVLAQDRVEYRMVWHI